LDTAALLEQIGLLVVRGPRLIGQLDLGRGEEEVPRSHAAGAREVGHRLGGLAPLVPPDRALLDAQGRSNDVPAETAGLASGPQGGPEQAQVEGAGTSSRTIVAISGMPVRGLRRAQSVPCGATLGKCGAGLAFCVGRGRDLLVLNLAPAIKMARAQMGLNQERLAAKCSVILGVLVTRDRIGTFETGSGQASVAMFVAMAEAMQLKPSELMAMAEDAAEKRAALEAITERQLDEMEASAAATEAKRSDR
jgi:transcriptional regulator with XRE-family HTH domain